MPCLGRAVTFGPGMRRRLPYFPSQQQLRGWHPAESVHTEKRPGAASALVPSPNSICFCATVLCLHCRPSPCQGHVLPGHPVLGAAGKQAAWTTWAVCGQRFVILSLLRAGLVLHACHRSSSPEVIACLSLWATGHVFCNRRPPHVPASARLCLPLLTCLPCSAGAPFCSSKSWSHWHPRPPSAPTSGVGGASLSPGFYASVMHSWQGLRKSWPGCGRLPARFACMRVWVHA